MQKNKYGRIVNFSSIHIPLATVGTSIYGASKAAVEQFSKILAREVFQFGINVNILALSIVKDTGMENVLTDEQWREFVRQYGKGVSVDGVVDWENISTEFDNFCEEESK